MTEVKTKPGPWQVKDVDPDTRKIIKLYAAKHGISIAEALAVAAALLKKKSEYEG